MANVKRSNNRKDEILNTAATLFLEKGFDGTSVADILDAVGIAKGTLYHYFDSKEEIMDELISRKTQYIIANMKLIAEDKSLSVEERLVKAIISMNVSTEEESKAMMEHMNKPQNALMHQKINKVLLNEVPPILAKIIQDGVNEKIFNTPYPLECMEVALIYLDTITDGDIFDLPTQELIKKIDAFFYNLERLLGVKSGELDYMKEIFFEKFK